ncbi:unnamed protein product [Oikopleura dioica]|uniref:Uncharacterized protein n=1 Tax=Oikopleura dioica TaxID=34765 RepID=E4YI18_OIKDI|nr:unnamed protein product [Oikopleura dioica]
MRFTLARLNYKVAYLGKWNKVPGDYDGGKHILPPKITAKDRERSLKELWREARNEMWLVRHKREAIRQNIAPQVSFQRPRNDEERTYESKRLTHDLALGPDVTFEDRFMNIAQRGNQWTKPTHIKYPYLQQHLETGINPKKLHSHYPVAVEKTLSWRDVKGFGKK